MRTRRIARIVVLVLFVCSPSLAASDEEGENLLSDLSSLQLDLGGAAHYYWITPEMGRVVINKQCVPSDRDCDNNVLAVVDESGRQVFERAPALDIPELSSVHIFGATLRTPDRLVLSANVPKRGRILAEYDVGSGDLVRVVSTGPISCWDLQGDEDGTLWCLGADAAKIDDDQDFDLVHRFDEAGRVLGSALPRSGFPPTIHPSGFKTGEHGHFLPGTGTVRLWLPEPGELISFSSDGALLDRLTLPTVEGLVRAKLAKAPDEEVFAMLTVAADADDPETWTQALYRLAPDGGSWIPLHLPPVQLPRRIVLRGADEAGLILLDRASLKLLWYPIPAETPDEETSDN